MRLPVGPARFLKTQHYIAVVVAAVLGLAFLAGFVWARKSITLVVDGTSTTVMTESADVASALAEAGVGVSSGDLVSPSPSASFEDGAIIVVRRVTRVTLVHGAETIPLAVVGRTVADALVMAGLDPTGGVSTDPAADTPLVEGMTITAKDVFLRVAEEQIPVPFETIVNGDPSLPLNRRVVVTKGVAGSAVRVWQAVVSGGVEGTRTLKAETVITEPVTEVVRLGTKRPFKQVVPVGKANSKNAAKSYAPPIVGKTILVEATAYTPYACGLDADWIAWRRKLYRAPAGWGVVAVDTKVIPMGTKLFVEDYGYAIAGDTGSAIKGNKIDVCFWGDSLNAPTGKASAAQERAARDLANRWGRKRRLVVTILAD